MTLLSLIAALLLEQLRPLPSQSYLLTPFARIADFLERHLNAGQHSHALIAWSFAVGGTTLAVTGVFFLLEGVNPVLAWAWNVLVLYLTMGFRQFSHFFTDIHLALRMGDVPRARQLLGEWRGHGADTLSSTEVARLAIEEALAASHRRVFAVLLCFVLLPGPSGAVLYRFAEFLSGYWGGRREEELGAFARVARTAYGWIDWLPQRMTAATFAIVGDFEDAIFCWRTQAASWADTNLGIILASGAGAIGVRLGQPVTEYGEMVDRPELGVGEEADVDFLQSTVGLVWRAMVLWLVVLSMLGIAAWLG